VLTEAGEVEMDALVMEGTKLQAGAVAAVGGVRNPVKVARAVLQQTDHCLLVGPGAASLAAECGLEAAGPDWLVTEAGRKEWEEFKQYSRAVRHSISHL